MTSDAISRARQPITRLNPPALPDASELGYSQVSIMEPGRLAFISGQVAWQPGGKPVPENLAEQAVLVARNAQTAIGAIGGTPADIVMARVYVTDLTPERVDIAMPHLIALFDGARPSLTGIGVAALAAPDLQIEMELTVRLAG